MPRTVWLLLAVAALGLLAEVVHTVAPIGPAWLFDDVIYNLLGLLAAGLVFARAATRSADRAAWLVLGAGMLSWVAGDLWWTFFLDDSTPFPNISDAMYLAFYPCALVAVILLARRHVRVRNWAVRLDGVVAALGLAALVSAVFLGPALAVDGNVAEVATNLAYVIEDMVLIAVVGAMSITGGRRTGAPWALLAAGLAVSAVADAFYLLQSAHGTYVEGGLLDQAWPAALLLVGLAAWWTVPAEAEEPVDDWRSRIVPLLCGVMAVAILVVDHFDPVPTVAVALAAGSSIAVLVRLGLTASESDVLIRLTRQEALSDPLTGLANRRALAGPLEEACTSGSGRSWILVVFDLNGFKRYNDTFGHPSGDALLVRLGHRLRDAEHGGFVYRLGGDEFCLLAEVSEAAAPSLVSRALAALSEHGEGFSVTSSHGSVMVPAEAHDPGEAMRIADRRMYAQKHSRSRGEEAYLREALMRTVQEGHPDLGIHQENVALLARATARGLGMDAEELDVTVRAAELHDIGKVAIPDEILNKAGPLSDEEWLFIRRHTIVGERILSAAPALAPVAKIVRASHERWDGAGYPDGTAGEEIPLGARVLAVCDAFDVMTADRPYKTPLTPGEAIGELLSCSGKQFDPRVVEAFCRHLASAGVDSVSLESVLRSE